MTSSSTLPDRARWYPITAAILVLIAVVLVVVALLDLHILPDGLLGFLTGLCAALAAGLVAVTEITRQSEAQRRDIERLDDLEPLRSEIDDASAHRAEAGQTGARQNGASS